MDKCGAGVKLEWVSLAVTNTERLEYRNLLNSLTMKKANSQKLRVAQLDMATRPLFQKKEIFTYGASTLMDKLDMETRRHIGNLERLSVMLMEMKCLNSIR